MIRFLGPPASSPAWSHQPEYFGGETPAVQEGIE
jgi:hypothetical protein